MILNILSLIIGLILGYFIHLIIKGNSKIPYYYYKGKAYTIVSEGKVKDAKSWWTCVIYKSVKDGKYYVRYKENFYRYFKTPEQFSEPKEGEQLK